MFADLGSGLAEKVAGYAIKCLAVGGGFLVGYFAGRGIAWVLDRWVFAQKAPDQLKKAVGVVCGIVLAILVALIVFGEGGSGLFGGGGGSGEDKGKGTQAPDEKGKTPAPVPPKEQPKVEPPKVVPKAEPPKDPPKPTPGDVRVAILAGEAVRDSRFYLIENDPTPRTLDELKKMTAERRAAGAPEPVLVFRFAKERLDDTHREMKRLDAWVKEAKLTSRFE